MEWEKAKNIVLYALLVLNVILIYSIYNNSSKYILSKKNENEIIKILEKNNIILEDDLIKDFSPKKKIILEKFDFNRQHFRENFFPDMDNVTLKREGEIFVYTSESVGKLHIYPNGFDFFPVEKLNFDEYSIVKAMNLASNFAHDLGFEFESFSSDMPPASFIELNNDGKAESYVCYLKENYDGFIINSNYLKIVIEKDGNYNYELRYMKPIEFQKNSEKNIYSSSEVLVEFLTLTSSDENYEEENELIITKMDFVYDIDTSKGRDTELVPFYRIFVKGQNEAKLIKAYT